MACQGVAEAATVATAVSQAPVAVVVVDRAASVAAEESFEVGLRHLTSEYLTHDGDGDCKLDFAEFSALIREREVGRFGEEELRRRFKELDVDHSGTIDVHEYVRFSLGDSLVRSSTRVVDLFRKWDADASGEIDKGEFRRAVGPLFPGIDARAIDRVFDECDADGSGQLDHRELNAFLRRGGTISAALQPGAVGPIEQTAAVHHELRRRGGGEVVKRLTFLEGGIDPTSAKPIAAQLCSLIIESSLRVIDAFRAWDTDGDGQISRAEFGEAMVSLLGTDAIDSRYAGPIDDLFDSVCGAAASYPACTLSWHASPAPHPSLPRRAASPRQLNSSGSGFIDFAELSRALRHARGTSLEASLQPGAAGVIELAARNKSRRDVEARLPSRPKVTGSDPHRCRADARHRGLTPPSGVLRLPSLRRSRLPQAASSGPL